MMLSTHTYKFFAAILVAWLCGVIKSAGALSVQPGVTNAARAGGANNQLQEPSNKATQIMQGIGPIQVDLNQYNLDSIDRIAMEWTANLRQKTAEKEVKVMLGVRNQTEYFVDNVEVQFPRRKGEGLGIELVEIAGGREDGLGITLVSGLVEGGPTQGLDILPGDSISKITLLRRSRRTRTADKARESKAFLEEFQEAIPVRTECLGFDATVQAILSLPEYNDEQFEDTLAISLKRIRRKPRVHVKLQYPPSQKEKDTTIELFAGENLRMGMLIRGVKLNDPLAKRFDTKNGGNCGAGGLCRTCAVSVLTGGELLNPQRLAEKQMLQDSPRWRLACKAIVGYGMKEGEMTIRVNPRQFD
ncbi:hypothetical protein ACA910_017800 [Epithemia clementina (nom. ined.)]